MKANLNLRTVTRALGASGVLSALVRVAPALALQTEDVSQNHQKKEDSTAATGGTTDMFDAMESVISKTVGLGSTAQTVSDSDSTGETGATVLASSDEPAYKQAGFTYPSANPHVQRDCSEPDPNVHSVLGKSTPLCACGVQGQSPKPGYFRNGFCQTDSSDFGSHILCGKSTTQFLNSQERKGNPLRSVIRHDGDEWCFCAIRWRQGYCMGEAVPVVLEATSDEVFKSFGITKRMIDDANDPNNGGKTQKFDCQPHMML